MLLPDVEIWLVEMDLDGPMKAPANFELIGKAESSSFSPFYGVNG
jgi:hypothetical protein